MTIKKLEDMSLADVIRQYNRQRYIAADQASRGEHELAAEAHRRCAELQQQMTVLKELAAKASASFDRAYRR